MARAEAAFACLAARTVCCPTVGIDSTCDVGVFDEHRNDADAGSTDVSLRLPDLVAALDRMAAALEQPRLWVMARALRQYIEQGEGAEIEEDTDSLAELDRGESAPLQETLEKARQIIFRAEARRISGDKPS